MRGGGGPSGGPSGGSPAAPSGAPCDGGVRRQNHNTIPSPISDATISAVARISGPEGLDPDGTKLRVADGDGFAAGVVSVGEGDADAVGVGDAVAVVDAEGEGVVGGVGAAPSEYRAMVTPVSMSDRS